MLYKIGIIGSTGKLGSLLHSKLNPQEFQLVLSASSTQWEETAVPDVLINISNDSATKKALDYCVKNRVNIIEGTSGLNANYLEQLKTAAKDITVLRAENFSYGHYLQNKLLHYLATLLKHQKCDLSVNERHCIGKKDSPSATAKKLAAVFDEYNFEKVQINAVRGGLSVSDHEIQIAFEYEELLLTHGVRNRAAAVKGIIKALRWMKEKNKGYWVMENVYNENVI